MSAHKCPTCGGPCWDETKSKFYKAGESPIAKCKDKNCGGKVFGEKGQSSGAAQQKAPAVPLEDLSAEYGKLLRSVAKNLATAAEGLPERMKPSFADAQAASATIWIQYRRQA